MSTAQVSLGDSVVVTDDRRRWFGLDALVTGANAIGYLVLAGVLDSPLGASAGTFRAVGAGLLAFAAVVAVHAIRRETTPVLGWAIVAINAVWVVGSLVVAIAAIGDFTAIGRAWISVQAVVVAALTAMQVRTMRPR